MTTGQSSTQKQKNRRDGRALVAGLIAGVAAGLIAYVLLGITGFIIAFIVGAVTATRTVQAVNRQREESP